MAQSVVQLRSPDQNYEWGETGSRSRVARYLSNTVKDFKTDEDKQYAEMWMGTYPATPAKTLEGDHLLKDILRSKNDNSTSDAGGKNEPRLPFLPKVLSIAKALPVQIHPSKEVAAKLHRQNPDEFEDPNHKPEIAVALTEFEMFIGNKPTSVIQQLLKNIGPFQCFQSSELKDTMEEQDYVRFLVKQIMTTSEDQIAQSVDQLSSLKTSDFDSNNLSNQRHIMQLVPRLIEQYGRNDPGIIIALLTMEYMVLQPGEGIFIPAGVVHAYLKGDCLECMAESDNILTAGFAPSSERHDANLFVQSIRFGSEYEGFPHIKAKVYEGSLNGYSKIYPHPFDEFDVIVTSLEPKDEEEVQAINGPTILVVTKGTGKLVVNDSRFELKEGIVYYIAPSNAIRMIASESLIVCSAFKNSP